MSESIRTKSHAATIVRYDGVIKRFGALQVLNGVSLSVHAGEVVCLIGPSGSGKSTLLRCTNGLEKLDGGVIEFEGTTLPRDERGLRAMRARMGMVFQSFDLFPRLTAEDNVAEGPRCLNGAAAGAARQRAAREGRAWGQARELSFGTSGGQRQQSRSPALAMGPMSCCSMGLRRRSIPDDRRGVVGNKISRTRMTMVVVTHK
jgi:polar amino acid transport system ATP-binding protein